jgi:PhzF family phenazine biosynthesis protein
VPLCGHATLATAHVLYEGGSLSADEPARFHTRSGLLTAMRRADGGVEMDFPVEPAVQLSAMPEQLQAGVPAELLWVGRNRLDYVIELADESTLRSLQPKLEILAELETRGFVVTARSAAPARAGHDYVLRFFAPRVGVAEDMVTGTAQCALAPYWRDRFADGRQRFTAFQASARGGLVEVELKGDRVLICGQAVTVLEGRLLA